ncbi:MAG: hypothetical protein PHI98_11130 [Eubacteriales bacterium]|nr:hypothetical protein [Eubacteriales bacterium]
MMKSLKSLLDLSRVPFTRHGCAMSIAMRQDDVAGHYGSVDELYLGITSALNTATNRADLVRIELLYNGESQPFTYTATPVLLTLSCAHGEVQLCMEENLLRLRGKDVQIRFVGYMRSHEGSCTREDNSWELSFKLIGKLLFMSLCGCMQAEGGLDWKEQHPTTPTITYGDTTGEPFEGIVSCYLSNGQRRLHYDAFDHVLMRNESEFEAFRAQYPIVPSEFEQTAIKAAYILWTHKIVPYGILKSSVYYMSRNALVAAYGWQQSYQAMALSEAPEAAWDALGNMFAYQLPEGQIPDWIHSNSANYLGCKPPFQGVALTWLLDHSDLNAISYEKCLWLYQALSQWARWWLNYRDSDHDGLPQYNNPDESGWDDASVFHMGLPVESPDLSTYLILLMEGLSRLAGNLHRFNDQFDWAEKSKQLLRLLLDELWTGERFVAKKSTTHELIKTDSIVFLQPIMLGKRLPSEIRQKLIASIRDEKRYLFQHGVASEALDSPYAAVKSGFARGVLPAPVQLMMLFGLLECGETALANEIALRFCRKVSRDGFALCHFPYDSEEFEIKNSDENTAFPTDMTLDTSWTAAIFLFLAGFGLDRKA